MKFTYGYSCAAVWVDILRDAVAGCHLRCRKGNIRKENQNTTSGGTNTVWFTLPSASRDRIAQEGEKGLSSCVLPLLLFAAGGQAIA